MVSMALAWTSKVMEVLASVFQSGIESICVKLLLTCDNGCGILQRYPFIAQARGVGLMVGIEFWDGPRHKRPASALTKWVQLEMLRRRIILSVDGPSNSVIKIKPPLVIGKDEVLMLSAELDQVNDFTYLHPLQAPCALLILQHLS